MLGGGGGGERRQREEKEVRKEGGGGRKETQRHRWRDRERRNRKERFTQVRPVVLLAVPKGVSEAPCHFDTNPQQ